MEVMLEIYRTLKALGMEWKEKKNLGGLGNLRAKGLIGGYGRGDKYTVERNMDLDGPGDVDLKAASSIYFVETRARVQDIVVSKCIIAHLCRRFKDVFQVIMNLQLYMVDSINYLVDFHHKKSYKASNDPGAGKFDMAVFDPDFTAAEAQTSEVMSSGRSVRDLGGGPPAVPEDEIVSPFIFMDLACRLILELAGGGGGE